MREELSNPFVTIIVPCRNEAKYISRCLDSVIANDYPKDRQEVLVVDGMSEDGSRETLNDYARRYSFIRVLDNPSMVTPSGLNVGLAAATGEIIMRLDAHSKYPTDYISALVGWLQRSGADNVGGICLTLPGDDKLTSRAIAACLSHPFGVGNAYFRIGSSEPRWVDTVPFGCYRKEVFERIGPFDVSLVRNQDDEFNHRLLRHGGRILLVPEIEIQYYARDSLRKLWKTYFQYGLFKPLVVLRVGRIVTWRQLVSPVFIGSLVGASLGSLLYPACWWLSLGIALAYALAAMVVSARIAAREGWRFLLLCPLVFAALHTAYGLGYLAGLLEFVLLRRYGKPRICHLSLKR